MNSKKSFNYLIEPSQAIHGVAKVMGDKSISHRSIMLSSLAKGKTTIKNCLMGEDNLATLAAMKAMGVKSQITEKGWIEIEGVGLHGLKAPNHELNLGNSGTAIRLLTGLLAGQKFKSVLTGDASILKRPMGRVADPLMKMGAKIKLRNGENAPIEIEPSALTGQELELKVPSAQVKSAILLAGLYANSKTTIHIPESLGGTRDHTEIMLGFLGAKIEATPKRIIIHPQATDWIAHDLEVPGDISSAAFLIAGALLSKKGEKLTIQNVGVNPTRTSLLSILELMGADITLTNQRTICNEAVCDIEVIPGHLNGIEIPENLIAGAIDEIPVLMVLAGFAKGQTTLKNAKELRFKESDRISSIVHNLRVIGIDCEEFEDGMSVDGLGNFPPPFHYTKVRLESYDDHRIAMAFSLAALRMKQAIEISHCENVDTSFPGYANLMKKLGLKITTQNIE